MKTKMISNWVLLIIAFLISVAIWMFVIQEDNPSIEISLGKVPVEILNEDVMYNNNLAYWITANEEVNVTVTVPQTYGWAISASDIKLTADLSNWHPGFATVPIEVEVVNNQNIIGRRYKLGETVVKIETEDMDSKEIDLTINTAGIPASGYMLMSSSSNLQKVTVKSPASELKRIVRAEVTVDIEGQTEDVQEKPEIILYDGNDDVLDMDTEQIFLNHSTAKVTAAIGKIKTVSLKLPAVKGKTAEGYTCTGVTSSVTEVQVAGNADSIDQINEIDLSEVTISVTDAKEAVEKTIQLSSYLPDKVQLVSNDNDTVKLTAGVEALVAKIFDISVSNIEVKNKPTGRNYTFNVDTVKCSIRGLSKDMDALSADNLSPAIDLENTTQDSIVVSVELGIDYATYELVSKPLITVSFT